MLPAASIAEVLLRGATIVAASPRAARALQQRYAEAQRAAGRTVWPSAPIADWDSWLRGLWRDHAFADPDAPLLLTPLQEQALWTRVQREDAERVVSASAMAALAMEAWSLLSNYNAHGARSEFREKADAESFRRWAAAFERECERNRWISFSQIAPLLAADAGLAFPSTLCLIGFDRLTPGQRDLIAALESRGIVVEQQALPAATSRRAWVRASDPQAEIGACAAWARERLMENPGTRIGIVVPGVDALRGPIDRIFRRVLAPASENILGAAVELPWEFSLGQPLADVPAIRAGLLLLRWIAEPLPAEEISWLLLSGFVSDTVTNPAAMARHDAHRRGAAVLLPEWAVADYAGGLPSSPDFSALRRDLAAAMEAAAANRVLSQTRQPSAWTELAHLLLDAWGWPGRRTPDSVEYQALQRWQRLLDDVALLDYDGRQCTFGEFLRLLEAHARETIFAAESHDAPVQAMSPFESSGQTFDAIWFLRACDTVWPQRGRLHPLIPAAVQRRYDMPSSTPEDDWNLAHAVTSRLLASATEIVFSYAERDGDAELRPSSLIAGLFAPGARAEAVSAARTAGEPIHLEPIPDEPGALPWPIEQHAGGADVLKRQAACPFQAFAAKRLSAEPLDCAERGLNPLEKGNLVHNILQQFFSDVRTRDELAAVLAAHELAGRLDRAIDSILGEYASESAWQQAYLAAERRRLQARLTEWLQLEAQREPFTVEAREQKLPDVHIGELRLRLRADRIDRLEDRTHLIVDYKTGNVSPASWRTDRPEDPQLPLYAAYGNVEELSGVVFARIRAGEMCFDGRVRNAKNLLLASLTNSSGLVREPYTDRMREEWGVVLTRLAERFLAGEAAVDPRKPSVCKYCAFPGLCRKAELNLEADDEDGEEARDA
jgi:ATP-dependent helicase/nuclease subunit B